MASGPAGGRVGGAADWAVPESFSCAMRTLFVTRAAVLTQWPGTLAGAFSCPPFGQRTRGASRPARTGGTPLPGPHAKRITGRRTDRARRNAPSAGPPPGVFFGRRSRQRAQVPRRLRPPTARIAASCTRPMPAMPVPAPVPIAGSRTRPRAGRSCPGWRRAGGRKARSAVRTTCLGRQDARPSCPGHRRNTAGAPSVRACRDNGRPCRGRARRLPRRDAGAARPDGAEEIPQ